MFYQYSYVQCPGLFLIEKVHKDLYIFFYYFVDNPIHRLGGLGIWMGRIFLRNARIKVSFVSIFNNFKTGL